MNTVFAEPQYPLNAEAGEERGEEVYYGFASNEITVQPFRHTGRLRNIRYIGVPTGLISLMRAIIPSSLLMLAREKGTSFCLEQDAQKRWVFCFGINGTDHYWALWHYTENNVPGWLVEGLGV